MFNSFESGEYREKIRNNYKKAPFIYPGSKFRALKHIMPYIPYARKYIEPFGGTGAVLLNRERSEIEVFNDRNSGIVDFYKCIRDKDAIEQVKRHLSLMPYGREDFINCRDNWASCSNIVERAAQWYYSVEASFSGFGKIFGRAVSSPTKSITDKFPLFDHVHSRLKNVLIENTCAFDLIKDFDTHDTIFYLDPPYMPGVSFADKYEETLNIEDHTRLCHLIMGSKGFFALSSYQNDLYDSFHWDKIIDYKILISSDSQSNVETNNKKGVEEGRQMRKEFLYIKEASL
jgi:DNA adenine methylase